MIRISPRIHVISATDARDPATDEVGLAGVEALETTVGDGRDEVAADALLQRNPPKPLPSALRWAGRAALALGPALVGVAAGSAALAGVGAVAGFGLAAVLYLHGRGGEPRWEGARAYEVGANRTRRIDSLPEEHAPGDTAAFLASRMAKHPQALKVVHLAGHGRGYRQAAGLPFDRYRASLEQAAAALNRPIDLLVVDSCLQGNLEALAGTWPSARYAVVSEEVQPGGQLPKLLAAACRELPVSAEELGRRIVGGVREWQDEMGNEQATARTLALVDMPRVPALVQAVDRLGEGLAGQVRGGGRERVAEVLEGVPVHPSREGEETRRKLRFGDLGVLAARVEAAFPGPLAAVAREVRSALAAAVVDHRNLAAHAEASGLSIQLPGPEVGAWETSEGFRQNGWVRHAESAAPRGWKDFLQAMAG